MSRAARAKAGLFLWVVMVSGVVLVSGGKSEAGMQIKS
jgi:hypothetical protein